MTSSSKGAQVPKRDPLSGLPVHERLSIAQARRIALGAQGFATPRPSGQVSTRHLQGVIDRIGLLQIDSVNVLSRSHYLPIFSRLGSYRRELLDRASGIAPRRLVEYWAHEASFVPPATHRLLRYRMARAHDDAWGGMRTSAERYPQLLSEVLDLVQASGAMTAVEIERTLQGPGRLAQGGWWNWSETKRAVEYLFWCGELTAASRTAQFERRYDLPARVLPAAIHSAGDLDPDEARRELIRLAAHAHGLGTMVCLRDYFRLGVEEARVAISALVELGDLVPVAVEGWSRVAYLDPAARRPRSVRARALLSPFDPLIWERRRAEDLFDYAFRLEIYTPAEKRRHGYYVLSFLLGERIVARVDLKADRQSPGGGALLVQASWAEDCAPPQTAHDLAAELTLMATWLGLARVQVEPRGDLAVALRREVEQSVRE